MVLNIDISTQRRAPPVVCLISCFALVPRLTNRRRKAASLHLSNAPRWHSSIKAWIFHRATRLAITASNFLCIVNIITAWLNYVCRYCSFISWWPSTSANNPFLFVTKRCLRSIRGGFHECDICSPDRKFHTFCIVDWVCAVEQESRNHLVNY